MTPESFAMLHFERGLEELGRMTLLFSCLDRAIAQYSIAIITDFSHLSTGVSVQAIEEMRFSDKCSMAKQLCYDLAWCFEASPANLLQALGRAKEVSVERNQIIHGWLTMDKEGRVPVFRANRGRERPATLNEIQRINSAILDIFQSFINAFGQMMEEAWAKVSLDLDKPAAAKGE